ncbi:hypothetical protein BJ508DRAFT_321780 [Ascobolus immersus RN42]|uniref:Uncharacterized protein n=1 Tax=Ascobolus immersus RN42 TaxID=1160509 RepID=A0A3N4IIY8_ASCIM|nr:hypothetical protein BJ508DRAFT_321780 [Ascobolus immersus RN42]
MAPAALEVVLYYYPAASSTIGALISWIGPYARNTIIYSASPLSVYDALQFKRVVYVPDLNIITESQAYLHHIATDFYSLADVTIFCHSRSYGYFTISNTRMMELASLTEVGEVMTFPGNDLVRFDTWELSSCSLAETTNKRTFGGLRCRQRLRETPHEPLFLSEPSLDTLKIEAHNSTTPASAFWDTMAPSGKIPKLPSAIAFQPGCTFAARRETIQEHGKDYWTRLYSQHFGNNNRFTLLEAGYYLSKFWWAFLSDDYVLYEGDVVDRKLWVMKSGGRKELTKGNWIRRLEPQTIVPDAAGRNSHHFRTRSCSIDAENPFIRDMALYGFPSLRPANEKNQQRPYGIVPARIELKKAHSMTMMTPEDMSKLGLSNDMSEKPASGHHRSASENSAY